MHTKVLTNKACWFNVWLLYSLCLHALPLLLQVIFAITQNQLIMPKMFVSAHASTSIDICV